MICSLSVVARNADELFLVDGQERIRCVLLGSDKAAIGIEECEF